MKKSVLITNLILIIAVLVGDVFYMINGSIWVKALTSLGFVAIGAVNLVYLLKTKPNDKRFAWFMLAGLVFSMLGDIFLEIIFILGAGLFAVGHVLYFVAYCYLAKPRWLDLIISACIAIPSVLVITLVPVFNFGGFLMEMVCIIYALVISCMVGKAVGNYVKFKSVLTLVVMIGSILFFFSDLMLLFNVFADISRVFGVLCLSSYYPAQILLGVSLLKYHE